MVDLDILEKHGLTQENLKTWFNVDPMENSPSMEDPTDAPTKRANLRNRIKSRAQEGRDRNFQNFRVYHALDRAWETPFRQVNPTLMQEFVNSNPTDAKVQEQLTAWGLNDLVTEVLDPKTFQPTGKKQISLPIFFQVLVPLVSAYVKIRWAKICNDRLLLPFFKYAPPKSTTELQMRCDTITDRVQVMTDQYSYFEVFKQSVFKMLHYGSCWQFVKEEWHHEKTRKSADAADVLLAAQNKEKAPGFKEGDEIECTAREGLRYHHPPPTRTFSDLEFPGYTINSDCGTTYCGYWHITRYRTVKDNPDFWNKDRITFGSGDLMTGNSIYFATVYSGCTMTIPQPQAPPQQDGSSFAAPVDVGTASLNKDRETHLANQFYGNDHLDSGVLITEYFEKLVPKDNGMGDYDCPVWFRFVIAGDGASILYACPLPYPPAVYYGYDEDTSRTVNASLSLEVLPFQDHFSNVLSQIILTAKQNLANLSLVDQDILEPGAIERLRNLGERFFRKVNIELFSGKKVNRGQNRLTEVMHNFNLPRGNVSELTNVLKTILDVLERVLVMSSHEVAQAASHEQTKEEVKNIAQSTTTRLKFTATPCDNARDAWKRQLYMGLMAYGDPYIYAHIPSEAPVTTTELEAMGFTWMDKDRSKNADPKDQYRRFVVHKNRTAIDIWFLTATRDGDDRVNDSQLAIAMAQWATQLLANPITAQAIGADQFIAIANRIGQLAGFPRDFKVQNATPPQASPEEQQAAAAQQLKQVSEAVLQQLLPQVAQELQPLLKQTGENTKDINLIMQTLNKAMRPMVDPNENPMLRNDIPQQAALAPNGH
jgi:hypothetical protein